MIFSRFKNTKHKNHLLKLSKISQSVTEFTTLYSPADFRKLLLKKIASATQRICIIALYLENDEGGRNILSALYSAKKKRPELDIKVLVDWHRAQRGRLGVVTGITNAEWYFEIATQHPKICIPIYGIPINTQEALGVLHLKGLIIDNTLLYTGASFNNIYLHQKDKYRYDRYQMIRNKYLVDTMFNWVEKNLLKTHAIYRLEHRIHSKITNLKKNKTRRFRKNLRYSDYSFNNNANNTELAITPLVGIGKRSLLNQTIYHLIACTEKKLIICTPYFNLPTILYNSVIRLLRQGKEVEIIVGDKTANDFYIPLDQPFKIVGLLPYMYEINLRCFLQRLQHYLTDGKLTVRIWKNGENSYHLKGLWVDEEWIMITGSNLNPRAWNLDLENALLIHDPEQKLRDQREHELILIRKHTIIVQHFHAIDSIAEYPVKIRRLIRRLRHIRIDRLIRHII